MPPIRRTRLRHSHLPFRPAKHGLLSDDPLKVFRVPKLFLKLLIIFMPNAPVQCSAVSTISNFTYARAEGVIAVRSASRLGYNDLGVNRRRIEDLRALLITQGIVGPLA